MDILQLRNEINQIDKELVRLFTARMSLSAQVADYKKANNLPIYDPVRECEVIKAVSEETDPALTDYIASLYRKLFELSRDYQHKCYND